MEHSKEKKPMARYKIEVLDVFERRTRERFESHDTQWRCKTSLRNIVRENAFPSRQMMSHDAYRRPASERINPKVHTLPEDRRHAKLFHANSFCWKRQFLVDSKCLPRAQCRPHWEGEEKAPKGNLHLC